MLNVIITVDTEVWPDANYFRTKSLASGLEKYIYGKTKNGEFGINYQIDLLNSNNLKGVFFLEPLFSKCTNDLKSLNNIVNIIMKKGHEVQLHLHPEWYDKGKYVFNANDKFMWNYSEMEQRDLIRTGKNILQECGVEKISAFRAGSFGANSSTLNALKLNDISIDSSFDIMYKGTNCRIDTNSNMLQPCWINDVLEFPVSYFVDFRNKYRHVQFCACSTKEIEKSLLRAWELGWKYFVILFHSFETIRNYNIYSSKKFHGSSIVKKRYEDICYFLNRNKDKFITMGFNDIETGKFKYESYDLVHMEMKHTFVRFVEQILQRIP